MAHLGWRLVALINGSGVMRCADCKRASVGLKGFGFRLYQGSGLRVRTLETQSIAGVKGCSTLVMLVPP